MRWALRFLLWGTPLTWMAHVFYADYLQILIRASLWVLALAGIRVELSTMDVLAPLDLALFASMALASTSLAWRPRLSRLALGIAVLFALEVALVVAGIALFLMPGAPTGPIRTFLIGAVGLMGWVGAPIIWMLLFGPAELARSSWAGQQGERRQRGPEASEPERRRRAQRAVP